MRNTLQGKTGRFNFAERARPVSGSGPPERAASLRQRILERLLEASSRGVLASDFYNDPQCRYGRSPRNRISELRKMGHRIAGKWEVKTDFRYTLLEETVSAKPLPECSPKQSTPSDDWYRRAAGKKRTTGLPLFDLAVRQ